MKLELLYSGALTLVLVAILLGVGLTVLDNISTQTRTTAIATQNGITLWTHNYTTLTNSYISSVSAYTNSTTDMTAYVVLDGSGTFGSTKVKLAHTTAAAYNGTLGNITYKYGATSTAQGKIDDSTTAIGGFVTWFTVIVVIIAAAVIIGMVLKSFRP